MYLAYILLILINILMILLSLKFKEKLYSIYHTSNSIQKTHEGYAPPIGGLIIFISFFIGIFGLSFGTEENQLYFFLTSLLILTIGLMEDFSGKIKPLYRFIIIFLASFLYINDQDSLPIIGIPILEDLLSNFPFFEKLFYTLCLTMIANGMNMIDGMNGLASMTALSTIGSLVSIVILSGQMTSYLDKYYLFAILIIIFLLFNFPFGNIFLGDSGAYWIGWVLGIWVIELHTNVTINTWVAVLILFYPAFEVFFSILRKVYLKKSPFQPDINHLHIKLYWFIKADSKKSNKYNSLTTICLMPLWVLPNIFTILIFYHSNLIFLFIIFMIILYVFFYILIPNKK
jgi:UDP-GlcNAc:undecaprenyl-phosphate GlcNAc-1-phosphate transferase